MAKLGKNNSPDQLKVALGDDVAALQGDPNFMLTLGRGLAVLGAFGTAKRKLTIAEISRMTGIPPQAVRRCLYTFTKLGFMGQDGTFFSPRPRLLSLGYVFFAARPIDTFARPVLDALHERFGLAFSIGVFDGDEITYIARTGGGPQLETSGLPRLDAVVPDRRPAHCTAPGRMLLASLSPDDLDRYLNQAELKPLTERTVTSPHILRAILRHIQEAGYAVVDQEAAIGLRSIALPISNEAGEPVAALGAAAIAAQWSIADLEEKVLPAMRTAAREISLSW